MSFEDLLTEYAQLRAVVQVLGEYEGAQTKTFKAILGKATKKLAAAERKIAKSFRLEKKMWAAHHEEMSPGENLEPDI